MTDGDVVPIARGGASAEDTAERLMLDLVAEAARRQDEARRKFREAVRTAIADGYSVSKIAIRAGLTRSRIYQIGKGE